MAIYVLPFCLHFLIIKPLKKSVRKEKKAIILMTIFYIMAMFYYCNTIDSYANIGMGIPGADMLQHFMGAKRLSEGASWAELANIGSRFQTIGLNTIGYFVYTELLNIMLYTFSFLPEDVNVYIVYMIQITFAINSAIKMNNAYNNFLPNKRGRVNYLYLILFCIPYLVQSSQLMRDIFYMFFIAIIMEKASEFYVSGNVINAGSKIFASSVGKFIMIVFFVLISTILRFYVVMLTIPILFYYTKNKKLGLLVSFAFTFVLIFGFDIVMMLKDLLGFTWTFGNVTLGEFFQFLLQPNIINQAKYILHWDRYFTELDVGGCNVQGVYYITALWNMYVLPLCAVGVISSLTKKSSIQDAALWLTMLINIISIYCVAYDSIDNRAKLLISIPILFFTIYGNAELNKRIKGFSLFYVSFVTIFNIFLLLIYV